MFWRVGWMYGDVLCSNRSSFLPSLPYEPNPFLPRGPREWETLLCDTARTLGLARALVHAALEAQVELLAGR